MIRFEVKLYLKLLNFSQIYLIVVHVDLGHCLPVAIAYFSIDLHKGKGTWVLCSFSN